MEGILWKWTNYWNGWQTRWFVLENDILTYYKSQEEVNQGCKGSIKVLACEINVNPVDSTRLDLVIPGEQRMYLRAASSQERQKWLVALGSAKACVNHHGILSTLPRVNNFNQNTENKSDILKSKRSELRLYCDLLMQQVHLVKTSAQPVNSHQNVSNDGDKVSDAADTDSNPNSDFKVSASADTGPDINRLDEATSLLTATCDTFIHTLEDIMKLSQSGPENFPKIQHKKSLSQTFNNDKKNGTPLRSNSQDR